MKRYLAFAGETYYPAPGWCDFVGDTDELSEAESLAKRAASETPGEIEINTWWQVVDSESGQIVTGEGAGHAGLRGLQAAGPTTPKGENP